MGTHTHLQKKTIREFAQVLYRRRKDGKPPVLLVGAGISIASGGPSGFDLMKSVVSAYRPTLEDWGDAVQATHAAALTKTRLHKILDTLSARKPMCMRYSEKCRGRVKCRATSTTCSRK